MNRQREYRRLFRVGGFVVFCRIVDVSFEGSACLQKAEEDGDDEDQQGNGKPEPPLLIERLFPVG